MVHRIPDGGSCPLKTEYGPPPPSVAIITAIAAIENTDPTNLDSTLYKSIDPDALNSMFTDDRTDRQADVRMVLEFTMDDYRVRVCNDGTITVKPPD